MAWQWAPAALIIVACVTALVLILVHPSKRCGPGEEAR